MIFSCGITDDEWKKQMKEWHRCFVIWPVVVGVRNGRKVCAWLTVVERRALHAYVTDGYRWGIYEHRHQSLSGDEGLPK